MVEASASCTSSAVHDEVLVITIMREQIRDTVEAYQCRDEMIALVSASNAADVVVDLTQVTFLGSVALLALLGVRRHLEGGRVVLCNASPAVRQMLFVCRLIPRSDTDTAAFEDAATIEAALERLAAAPVPPQQMREL